jgi:hypothetical protein
MTLNEFLADLKTNLEADIGEGQLNRADIEHIRAVSDELLTTAAGDLDVSND